MERKYEIDHATGLPVLPEGMTWVVRKGEIAWHRSSDELWVSIVSKKTRVKRRFPWKTTEEYDTTEASAYMRWEEFEAVNYTAKQEAILDMAEQALDRYYWRIKEDARREAADKEAKSFLGTYPPKKLG